MQAYCLFISYRGRVKRVTFGAALLLIWTSFFSLYILIDALLGSGATIVLYPLVLWMTFAVAAKRYHDLDHSSARLAWIALPILGPMFVGWELLFRRSFSGANRHGIALEDEVVDYLTTGIADQKNEAGQFIVNDVTNINPIGVDRVLRPESIDELQQLVASSTGPLCIGGGRFSMGGQTASPGAWHIDMRGLNKVLEFLPEEPSITVQAGIRWCDIQRFIDPHGLSIKTMQTYANFTVGGALSVNCHGRYIGFGPLILSVLAIKLMTPDGVLIEATPQKNAEIFFASIGGYAALGIIVEVKLSLAQNKAVSRTSKRMPLTAYRKFFAENIQNAKTTVFHNADLYPSRYDIVNAVTWSETTAELTSPDSLLKIQRRYPINRVFFWIFSETHFGVWYRQYLVDPLLYLTGNVRMRNLEAGYDVEELEPVSRLITTYVLQEYFVPVARLEDFVAKMREIFVRHKVNVVNVSIRHAIPDSGSYLAWARQEVFALVVYYKQHVHESERSKVGVWTRELIDAVISTEGAYYLPYQAHATEEQFHCAYPRAKELFQLKRKIDPHFRMRHVLWNQYYAPWLATEHSENKAL